MNQTLGPRESVPGNDTFLVLEDWLPHEFTFVSNLVSAMLRDMYQKRYGMSVMGWRVLVYVCTHECAAKDVAEHLGTNQVAVTRAIKELRGLDLISRTVDESDRRWVLLRPTVKGLRACTEIVPLAREVESVLLSTLEPQEEAALRSAMKKLLQTAEEKLKDPSRWAELMQSRTKAS